MCVCVHGVGGRQMRNAFGSDTIISRQSSLTNCCSFLIGELAWSFSEQVEITSLKIFHHRLRLVVIGISVLFHYFNLYLINYFYCIYVLIGVCRCMESFTIFLKVI